MKYIKFILFLILFAINSFGNCDELFFDKKNPPSEVIKNPIEMEVLKDLMEKYQILFSPEHSNALLKAAEDFYGSLKEAQKDLPKITKEQSVKIAKSTWIKLVYKFTNPVVDVQTTRSNNGLEEWQAVRVRHSTVLSIELDDRKKEAVIEILSKTYRDYFPVAMAQSNTSKVSTWVFGRAASLLGKVAAPVSSDLKGKIEELIQAKPELKEGLYRRHLMDVAKTLGIVYDPNQENDRLFQVVNEEIEERNVSIDQLKFDSLQQSLDPENPRSLNGFGNELITAGKILSERQAALNLASQVQDNFDRDVQANIDVFKKQAKNSLEEEQRLNAFNKIQDLMQVRIEKLTLLKHDSEELSKDIERVKKIATQYGRKMNEYIQQISKTNKEIQTKNLQIEQSINLIFMCEKNNQVFYLQAEELEQEFILAATQLQQVQMTAKAFQLDLKENLSEMVSRLAKSTRGKFKY